MDEIAPPPSAEEPVLHAPGHDPRAARIAFYVYFTLAAALLVVVVRPFLTTLLVAAVLAVWLRPIYLRLIVRYPYPKLLSLSLTLAVCLLVLAPIGWAITKTFIEVGSFAHDVSALVGRPEKMAWLTPWLERAARLSGIPLDDLPRRVQGYLSEGAGTIVAAVGAGAREVLGATARIGLNAIILIFALMTFIRHGGEFVDRFKRLSPLDDALEDRLIGIFAGFSRGIVLGGFVTAVVQGLIAGVGYAIVGIEESLFWGVMTGLFSFVPFVGTALIWVPLALTQLVQGNGQGAAFLAVYSVVLTGSVDNLIKPWLIGQSSTLDPLLLFLSIFGGLMTLGPAGVLIGPVAASFVLALAEVYEASMLRRAPVAGGPSAAASGTMMDSQPTELENRGSPPS